MHSITGMDLLEVYTPPSLPLLALAKGGGRGYFLNKSFFGFGKVILILTKFVKGVCRWEFQELILHIIRLIKMLL
jgi:hypothetical protein